MDQSTALRKASCLMRNVPLSAIGGLYWWDPRWDGACQSLCGMDSPLHVEVSWNTYGENVERFLNRDSNSCANVLQLPIYGSIFSMKPSRTFTVSWITPYSSGLPETSHLNSIQFNSIQKWFIKTWLAVKKTELHMLHHNMLKKITSSRS